MTNLAKMEKEDPGYILNFISSFRRQVEEQTGVVLDDDQIGSFSPESARFRATSRFELDTTIQFQEICGGVRSTDDDVWASDDRVYRALVDRCAEEELTVDESFARLFSLVKQEGFLVDGSERTVRNCRRRIFYQYDCNTCAGYGALNCGTCGATGKVTCTYCYGLAQVNCYTCGGRGQTYSYDRWQRCAYCNGSGKNMCPRCQYGKATCTNCGGGGDIRCNGCGGARVFTRVSQITVTTVPSITFDVDPEFVDHQLIRTYVSPNTYPRLASIALVSLENTAQFDFGIEFYYQGRLRAFSFTVTVGEAIGTVQVLGDPAQVDYGDGLYGKLLMRELDALLPGAAADTAAGSQRFWSWSRFRHLNELNRLALILQRFCSYKAHQSIIEMTAKKHKPRDIAHETNFLVSEPYAAEAVRRVTNALRRMDRIVGVYMFFAIPILSVILMICLMVIAEATGAPQKGVYLPTATLLTMPVLETRLIAIEAYTKISRGYICALLSLPFSALAWWLGSKIANSWKTRAGGKALVAFSSRELASLIEVGFVATVITAAVAYALVPRFPSWIDADGKFIGKTSISSPITLPAQPPPKKTPEKKSKTSENKSPQSK